ncbi:MAG: hypothetical protein JO363_14040 [Solirubrobacterales bacterium]|nr:hypothetical protein [Solirubrobacterales bacterium]
MLVASGRATFAKAGQAKLTIKLTRKGKQMLKGVRRLKLTARGTYTSSGRAAVTATRTFTLKR